MAGFKRDLLEGGMLKMRFNLAQNEEMIVAELLKGSAGDAGWRDAMIAQWTAVEVVTVLFLATIIRSAFGFGEALVAVPLLALVLPVEVAAPVAVLVSITIAFVVVVQDWRHVHVRSAGWLLLFTLAGIPLGLLLLKEVAAPIVKALLAVVIVAFAIFSLLGSGNHELKNDRWAWLFGFVAGVMGGAYGMNGPPLAIFGSLRKWSPAHFRATLQGYFLPASLVGMCGYWVAGLWTPVVSRLYLLSLPAVLLGIFLGRMINRRANTRQFHLIIQVGLLVIGAFLLLQSATGHRQTLAH
jgi:uncharacterized protein